MIGYLVTKAMIDAANAVSEVDDHESERLRRDFENHVLYGFGTTRPEAIRPQTGGDPLETKFYTHEKWDDASGVLEVQAKEVDGPADHDFTGGDDA